MNWLIMALLGLALLSGLAVVTRGMGRLPQPEDDTLVTELLGPPDGSLGRSGSRPRQAGRPPSVVRAWDEARASAMLRMRKAAPPADSPPARAPRTGPGAPARPPAPARPRAEATPPAGLPAQPGPGRSPTTPPPQEPPVPAAPAAPPAAEGDWLQSQLAWITSWSQYMQDQITSTDESDSGPETET